MVPMSQALLMSLIALQDGSGGGGTGTGTAPATDPCMGGGIASFIPIILMVGIIYFLMIRPQQKQQKELRNMRDNLKKDDRVVTTGGIHGVVSAIKGDVVTLRVADGVKIDFDRAAITGLDRRTETE